MLDNLQKQSSDLFTDLSETEQESISGGFTYPAFGLSNIFLQRTEIASFANNSSNYSDGIRSFSSRQESGYSLSQTSFGFNIDDFSGSGGRRGRIAKRRRQYFLNMLFQMLSIFG
jgi:hypothetical protein